MASFIASIITVMTVLYVIRVRTSPRFVALHRLVSVSIA